MAKKAAEGIVRGLRLSRALREAGYSKSTSYQGKLNKMIRAELAKMGMKYIKIGRDLTPEDQENLVRGMLYENVIMRSDKGVQAAKQLGADKRVSMWRPDGQIGMVVIKAPEVPKIDHPIKLVEAKFKDEDGI
jgi:hypothetical protein